MKKGDMMVIVVLVAVGAVVLLLQSQTQAVVPTQTGDCLKIESSGDPGMISTYEGPYWLSLDRDDDGNLEGYGYLGTGSLSFSCSDYLASKSDYYTYTAIAGSAESGYEGDVYIFTSTVFPLVKVCRETTGYLTTLLSYAATSDNTAGADITPCSGTCIPNWDCSAWSSCVGDQQTRTCTDLNSCGTNDGKPAEQMSCSVGGDYCTTGCVGDIEILSILDDWVSQTNCN